MSSGYLTRIQNNQITDSTINAANKILPGSIQGNLLAASVTFNSNITILGNLTVSNSYTQLNSINTYINDPIVVFNNGYSGSLTNYDIGILVNRNLASLGAYGSVNTFLGWSESAQAFIGIATTETGTSVSSINNSGYANLIMGNASLVSATITNNLTVGSFTAPTSTLTTLNATTGNVITLVATNFSSANAIVTTLETTNFSTANAVITGGSLNGSPIGATSASTGAFTTLTTSGTAIYNGNIVAASGTSSTNTTTGALVVVGGAGISGAVNVGGATNISGVTTLSSTTPTTGVNTGALQVTNGGAYIAGNLYVGGNINFTPNSVSVISGNSAQFFGNAAGFGALYAGIASGYVVQPQTVLQNSTNFNGYAQVNHQNVNSGASASTDYVATMDTGSATAGYIDMGINGSGFNGPTNGQTLSYAGDGYVYVQAPASGGLGNLLLATAASTGNIFFATGGQNINNQVMTITTANTVIVTSTVAATSTSSGALQVQGGLGVAGAVYAGSIVNTPISGSTGYFTTAEANNFSTANALITGGSLSGITNLNVTTETATNFASGNAQITGGSLSGITNLNVTTETATNFASGNAQITGGAISGTPISGSTGSFTTLSSSTQATLATAVATNFSTANAVITGGSVNSTPIGATTASTGAFTTLTTSGVATVNGNLVATSGTTSTSTTTGALVVAGGVGVSGDAFIGGNLKVSGTLTYINTTTELVSGVEIVAGNLVANSGTASSSTSTGALVVIGGAGISGAVNVGGALTAGSLTGTPISGSTGNFTTEVATNFSTGNAQITGGAISGTPISGSTGNFTTAVTTNFSTANAVITGGSITGDTSGTFTTLEATNFSTGNAQIANGSGAFTSLQGTTTQATNFSTANAVITGGHIDGTSVGLYTPSTGAFTTLNASGATTLNTLSTTGTAINNGNIVAASGTGSVSTTTGAMVVVGGMGVSGNINVGNSSALHQISGNLLLGLGTASASALTTLEVNQNAGVPQSSTSVIHVSALSGVTGKITLDSFGSASSIGGSAMILRTSAGTSASPSAVQQNQILGGFIARGYGATGYLLANIALSAGMIVQADQNFTDTAQGTKLNFNVIPLGSNVAIDAITVSSNGNVLINQYSGSSSTTTGALVVNGGVGIGGNLNIGGTSTVTGVATFQANVVITSQAVSSSTTTGALVIPAFGGAGIGGNLNVGGNSYVGGISYLGPISNSISLTNPIMVGTGNGNNTVQVSIQNTSTGASASTDYVATADNGTDTTHYIDMGINGSGFNGPANGWTISGADDGYLYVDAGNLTLGTDTVGKNVAVHVGGTFANNIVATFNANSIGATSTTATAVINGGLTLTGAAGNLYVAGTGGTTYTSGMVVNHGQASAGTTGASNQNAFIVQGANDSTLLYAKPLTAYDAVIIGGNGASTSFTQGAKLVINSTDSILLPVGSNAGRPSNSGGTDVAGMFRYSTTAGAIEYYNGTTWTSPSSAFTVIADQQFTGTGSQTAFTLNTAQTTASCIVSINGIVQIPTSAYSVSGTTLTFTEAPQSTDIIDVRQLTTTVTVTSLSDSTGYNSVLVNSSGVQITTGTSVANVIASYTTGGAIVNSTPNVTVASSSVATTVDSFYANTYSSAEYTVTATIQGTNIRQIAKVLVVTDGTNAYVTPYGITSTAGNTLATFGGNVSAGSVNFQATATNANTILRMHKQYQAV